MFRKFLAILALAGAFAQAKCDPIEAQRRWQALADDVLLQGRINVGQRAYEGIKKAAARQDFFIGEQALRSDLLQQEQAARNALLQQELAARNALLQEELKRRELEKLHQAEQKELSDHAKEIAMADAQAGLLDPRYPHLWPEIYRNDQRFAEAAQSQEVQLAAAQQAYEQLNPFRLPPGTFAPRRRSLTPPPTPASTGSVHSAQSAHSAPPVYGNLRSPEQIAAIQNEVLKAFTTRRANSGPALKPGAGPANPANRRKKAARGDSRRSGH